MIKMTNFIENLFNSKLKSVIVFLFRGRNLQKSQRKLNPTKIKKGVLLKQNGEIRRNPKVIN
jgi:hypothetical protein